MQNENVENKTNQIRRNPTRFNKNTNRGENEKSFDQENSSDADFKVDSSQLADDETRLGNSGESDTSGGEISEFSGGAETGDYDGPDNITENQQGGKFVQTTKGVQQERQQSQQQSGEPLGREKNEANQAGAGADYGAASQEQNERPDIREETDENEKRLAGGSNKGAQIPGASGQEDDSPRHH